MLTALSIRNFAVIEAVQLQFQAGFQVLTGETGAGKSMIIDALALIAGGRGSTEFVRHGSDKAEISASFELRSDHPVWDVLTRLGIDGASEEGLVIQRTISGQGKSTGRINGQIVNLSMLRQVGEWLVNIHGQHEHQSLLKTEQHIELLDLYGEAEIAAAKESFKQSYRTFNKLRKQKNELEESSRQALQMQDMYRFQINEIHKAALVEGEDESLTSEKRKLANAEKLTKSVNDAYSKLYEEQGLASVADAMRSLEHITAYDSETLRPMLEQVQSAYYQLEDAAFQIRDYRDQIEFDPERLDEIENRLALIASLQRKYGDEISEVLQYLSNIEREMERLETRESELDRLAQEMDQVSEEMAVWAAKLSDARQEAAVQLAADIEQELSDLHMEKTRFKVHISRLGNSEEHVKQEPPVFNANGWDDVEFLISPNPGEPMRSLNKIASGGELSRIMLALKTIFARMDRIPVLVFDEVDTGVSGRAAQAIAEKISLLSRECQVFSITHLPQVACMADTHYFIFKEVQNERTYTQVKILTREERIHDLARMLGGVEVTDTTLHHAQEMLDLANDKKICN